jgi:hypothetical protein
MASTRGTRPPLKHGVAQWPSDGAAAARLSRCGQARTQRPLGSGGGPDGSALTAPAWQKTQSSKVLFDVLPACKHMVQTRKPAQILGFTRSCVPAKNSLDKKMVARTHFGGAPAGQRALPLLASPGARPVAAPRAATIRAAAAGSRAVVLGTGMGETEAGNSRSTHLPGM